MGKGDKLGLLPGLLGNQSNRLSLPTLATLWHLLAVINPPQPTAPINPLADKANRTNLADRERPHAHFRRKLFNLDESPREIRPIGEELHIPHLAIVGHGVHLTIVHSFAEQLVHFIPFE